MKKSLQISAVFTLLSAGILAGCGNNANEGIDDNNEVNEEEQLIDNDADGNTMLDDNGEPVGENENNM
ncbi:hypothetical protein [Alkalicoccus daliensis]|uniref:Uncharacterized protein n=1 Tax=Alkalicoccus daliensis TaxID=745820 RepID=A0A1H0JLS0_9BACI|nr:hypothetical protein [Alkalicoccus daliensis]SDO44728.1 hypothetical protein SAMN04488053_11416 [Alkalicoccus daliensis]